MDGNETIKYNRSGDPGQTSGSGGLQSQIHLEVDSHIYESALDNADDFFMQGGFTGLLLGGLTGNASIGQDTDKVSSH